MNNRQKGDILLRILTLCMVIATLVFLWFAKDAFGVAVEILDHYGKR